MLFERRKRQLRSIVPGSPSPLLYVYHVAESGTALYRAVCERDLEEIVAQRANAYGEQNGKPV